MKLSRRVRTTTLADVIGSPDTWADFSIQRDGQPADMRRARISEFSAYPQGIAIATSGGRDGPTYNVFTIEDAVMRARILKALRVGLDVESASKLAI